MSFHSTSTAARAAGVSESYVKYAERIGVIKPKKDQLGRRILTERDIRALRAHRARKKRSAS
jgi:DNA-binding transcriptional MerR regulator